MFIQKIYVENFHSFVCIFFYDVIPERRRFKMRRIRDPFAGTVIFVKLADTFQISGDAFAYPVDRRKF